MPDTIVHDPMAPRPRGVLEAEDARAKTRPIKRRRPYRRISLTPPRSDVDIVFANAHRIEPTMPNPTHPTVLDNCRRCGNPAELEGPDSLCATCETDATAEVIEKLGEREAQEAIAATTPVVDEDGFRYGPISHPSITPTQLFGAYRPMPVFDRYSRGERGQFS